MRYLITLLVLLILVIWSCPLMAQQPVPELDLDAASAEAIATLQDLIRLDTRSPPGNESLVAEYLSARLAADGIESQIFTLEEGRGNLVARLPGTGEARPLLLMAHTDVVGVERSSWTVDPFGGEIRDGYVHGRGAVDDKGMLAAAVEVLRLIKRSGIVLRRDLILLAEAGEEGTTRVGIDFMIERHWGAIDSEFALNEGGGLVWVGGQVKRVDVATTEKVPLRGIELIARGTSGHGSVPRADNPIVALSRAVTKVGELRLPMRLNDSTRAFFLGMAERSEPSMAFLYQHLEDPILAEMVEAKLLHLDPRSDSLLRTTISPTILEGGFRRNVIPAEARAVLDVRALPDEDPDVLIETLVAAIGDPRVEVVAATSRRPSAPPSSLTSELFVALVSVQERLFPAAYTQPVMLSGATDSAQLRAKGVETYGIGLALGVDDHRAHGNDERVPIDGFRVFLEYLLETVLTVAADHDP